MLFPQSKRQNFTTIQNKIILCKCISIYSVLESKWNGNRYKKYSSVQGCDKSNFTQSMRGYSSRIMTNVLNKYLPGCPEQSVLPYLLRKFADVTEPASSSSPLLQSLTVYFPKINFSIILLLAASRFPKCSVSM